MWLELGYCIDNHHLAEVCTYLEIGMRVVDREDYKISMENEQGFIYFEPG